MINTLAAFFHFECWNGSTSKFLKEKWISVQENTLLIKNQIIPVIAIEGEWLSYKIFQSN